jgi:hypothetical protein
MLVGTLYLHYYVLDTLLSPLETIYDLLTIICFSFFTVNQFDFFLPKATIVPCNNLKRSFGIASFLASLPGAASIRGTTSFEVAQSLRRFK